MQRFQLFWSSCYFQESSSMDVRRNMIHAITGLSMGIALLGCEKNKGEVDITPKKNSNSQLNESC